jgi:hypothetical protein
VFQGHNNGWQTRDWKGHFRKGMFLFRMIV